MTWNELIYELQQIPEERREEQAIFMTRMDGEEDYGGMIPDEVFEIDSKEEIPLDEISTYANVGNDETNTTFVIAQ